MQSIPLFFISSGCNVRSKCLTCSAFGGPVQKRVLANTEGNTESSGAEDERSESDSNAALVTSGRCKPRKTPKLNEIGCTFCVRINFDKEADLWRISQKDTLLCFDHAGRCQPSLQNLQVRNQRRGRNSLLTGAQATQVLQLHNLSTPMIGIRMFLRDILGPDAVLTAKDVCNILVKIKVIATNDSGIVDSRRLSSGVEVFMEDCCDPSLAGKDHIAEEIAKFIVAETLQQGGFAMANMLDLLAKKSPGFLYRIALSAPKVGEAQRPVGVAWSTQKMRFSLRHYGDVVFLDSMKNGHNNLRWPFWIPSGINQVPPNSSLRYSNPFQIP